MKHSPRFEAAPTIATDPASKRCWDVLDHAEKTVIPLISEKNAKRVATALNNGTDSTVGYCLAPHLYPKDVK